MPVSIKKLVNLKNNPNVRSVVSVGEDVVKIFEPTSDQLREIVDVQERWLRPELSEVEISGEDLIRIIFPMLTDIQGIDDMSDDDVREMVSNPSMLFTQVQMELESLISEIYSTLILAHKRNINHIDLEFALTKQSTVDIEKMISKAPSDVRKKIEDILKEYDEDDIDDEEAEFDGEKEFNSESGEKIIKLDKHQEKLNQYLKRFNDEKEDKEVDDD